MYCKARNYCDREKIDPEILMDSQVFNPSDYKTWLLVCCLAVCVCVCLRARAPLSSERLGGLYSYSTFKSSSIIGRCPVNLGIPAPEI
jgi:hypothetical protein